MPIMDAETRWEKANDELMFRHPKTRYERNPMLYEPREGEEYVTCGSCDHCMRIFVHEAPWALTEDLGLCAEYDYTPVRLDEKRVGDDADCYVR